MKQFTKVKDIPPVVGAEIKGLYEVTSMQRCVDQEDGRVGFIQLGDETGVINALWCEEEGQVDEGDLVCVQGEVFEHNEEEIALTVQKIQSLEEQCSIKNLEKIKELRRTILSMRTISGQIKEEEIHLTNIMEEIASVDSEIAQFQKT